MLYSEDTTTLQPAYSYYDKANSDKLHDLVELDISNKIIQNKFNEFIIRYELVNVDGFASFANPHVLIYQSKIPVSYSMIFNQENQNPLYKENVINFDPIETVYGDDRLDHNKDNCDPTFHVSLNSIKYKDNIIQSLVLDKFVAYYVGSDDVIQFDSPITKLAIYGATPIYK